MAILLSLLISLSASANYSCTQYEASTLWGKVFIQTESHYVIWEGEVLSNDETRIWGAFEASCVETVSQNRACGYFVWNLTSRSCQN